MGSNGTILCQASFAQQESEDSSMLWHALVFTYLPLSRIPVNEYIILLLMDTWKISRLQCL